MSSHGRLCYLCQHLCLVSTPLAISAFAKMVQNAIASNLIACTTEMQDARTQG